MIERGMCAFLSRSADLGPTAWARADCFRGTHPSHGGVNCTMHGAYHVASSNSSPEMCVSFRGSLWVWRNGRPNLHHSSAQNGPPLLPQTFPLKHTYLHAPFEMSVHPVHPELQFELSSQYKHLYVRAWSQYGATALLCSPLHTPPALARCPHFRPTYPLPYLPQISMDCHVDGHYGDLRIKKFHKPCVSCPESIPSMSSNR